MIPLCTPHPSTCSRVASPLHPDASPPAHPSCDTLLPAHPLHSRHRAAPAPLRVNLSPCTAWSSRVYTHATPPVRSKLSCFPLYAPHFDQRLSPIRPDPQTTLLLKPTFAQVMDLESSVRRGTKVAEKEFVVLTELLIMQLLKLDGIEAEGEAKVERKIEVRRIQHFLEMLDALKLAAGTNFFRISSNGSSSTTQCQTFDSGRGKYASVMIKKATPSRVRPREPYPSYTDVSSSAHKLRRRGETSSSKIFRRRPSDDGSQNEGIQNRLLMYLRDMISNLDPKSPESFDCFTSKANVVLDFLAHDGVDEADLRHWEELCREIEILVRQFKAFSIVHAETLPELRQQVTCRRAAMDEANGEYQRSVEAMQQHQDRSASDAAEMESLSSKIKSLEGELASLISCKTDLQLECDSRAELMEREQHCLQTRHRAMKDAKVAFTKAVENLKATEVEYQSLDTLKTQLRVLQARLL